MHIYELKANGEQMKKLKCVKEPRNGGNLNEATYFYMKIMTLLDTKEIAVAGQ